METQIQQVMDQLEAGDGRLLEETDRELIAGHVYVELATIGRVYEFHPRGVVVWPDAEMEPSTGRRVKCEDLRARVQTILSTRSVEPPGQRMTGA